MDFREKSAIYLQIAEYVYEKVLLGKWAAGEKLISIRDLAVDLEVNPNTVQRSYDFLQQNEIIINKRGIGYFIADDAEKKILLLRREQFLSNDLPLLFKNMYLLDIKMKDVISGYEKFIKANFKTHAK